MKGTCKRNICSFLAFFFLLSTLAAGCAISYDKKGSYHRVQSGETLWKIASVYRVSAQDMAELNNIEDGSKLEPGMKLYIPPRPKGRSWKKLPQKDKENVYNAPIKFDRSRFIWPVDGKVMSGFGIRNGRRHDGIDISAKSGTHIVAAATGQVAFSGRLSGYGNMVIIKHADNFFSIYAHNSKNLVKKGKKVKQGDLIAYVGQTGRATGPHLHFEIRNRQKARNPLFFLPVKK